MYKFYKRIVKIWERVRPFYTHRIERTALFFSSLSKSEEITSNCKKEPPDWILKIFGKCDPFLSGVTNLIRAWDDGLYR